jgi:glycosyltransferase involved in cell wall biosynthesis
MAEGGERMAENGVVFLPGFRQVGELPRFYAGAGAFVHASLSEQWGLVVNEAMACALPVLVSDRCGCAKDLVQDGVNGYTFVVYPMIRLAEKFSLISGMAPVERVKMGLRGREIIQGWGAEAFAKGFLGAAKAALSAPRKSRRFFSRAVLEAFCARQLR